MPKVEHGANCASANAPFLYAGAPIFFTMATLAGETGAKRRGDSAVCLIGVGPRPATATPPSACPAAGCAQHCVPLTSGLV